MGEPSAKNLKNADEELQSHVNPVVDMGNITDKEANKSMN